MTGDPSGFDPQKLWQDQQKEYDPVTLADIHAKARAFDAKVQRRNAIEYVACGVVIVAFAPGLLIHQSWLMQAGAAWSMFAAVYVAWQLHRRASTAATPEVGETLVDVYRRQLIRQRNAIRTVGLWYIAPLVPGMVLILLGRWFQMHARGRSIAQDHAGILVAATIAAIIVIGVWLLNLRGARRLQKRLDDL